MNTAGQAVLGLVVPGRPHPLLAPEQNPGYQRLRDAFEQAALQIKQSGAELILLYSTQWVSIIGHQIQAAPEPQWIHVDQEWHALGSMPYKFRIDTEFAQVYKNAAEARGLTARTVNYKGFPIDTGTITALTLLNPDNRLKACVVSCNMYADRAETLVLGKAAADAILQSGRKTAVVAITALSNRLFSDHIDPLEDHIHSAKDDEWNRKLLELFGEGRLEDVAQLARTFSTQANADQKLKALWWLAACMGQHNRYKGHVHAYEPVCGTGAAVISMTPSAVSTGDLEFDEEDVDKYKGDRDVLAGAAQSTANQQLIHTQAAPKPVGAYPHARRVGDLLFLSGCGPRTPGTDVIPGGPIRDSAGNALQYDIKAQTRQVVENVKAILEAAGSSLDKVLDVTVFLIDMDRDFAGFNQVYGEYFAGIEATRTTLSIRALPTPIAVEFKVLASAV